MIIRRRKMRKIVSRLPFHVLPYNSRNSFVNGYEENPVTHRSGLRLKVSPDC